MSILYYISTILISILINILIRLSMVIISIIKLSIMGLTNKKARKPILKLNEKKRKSLDFESKVQNKKYDAHH